MNVHEKINARSYFEPFSRGQFRVERKIPVDGIPITQPCANDIGWLHIKKHKLFKLKF